MNDVELRRLLEGETPRVLVIGVPRSGKTTFANWFGKEHVIPVKCTDHLIMTHKWHDASDEVCRWLDAPGPWVVEGVAAVRGLRKFFKNHHRTEKPCDVIFNFDRPLVPLLSPGQLSMARGCASIWTSIERHVRAMGIPIVSFGSLLGQEQQDDNAGTAEGVRPDHEGTGRIEVQERRGGYRPGAQSIREYAAVASHEGRLREAALRGNRGNR